MFKFIYRKAIKLPKLESFNNYLFIGPHPDDIEIGCGATVKKLTSMNKNVSFVVATDGRIGSIDQSISEEELVKLRQKEALESAKVLGVDNVFFLGFHDGDDYDIKEIEKEILRKIIELKPDIVFIPDHTLRTEYHPDHINVGKASCNAIMKSEFIKITKKLGIDDSYCCKNIALYYTDKPNTIVKCKPYFNDKCKALRCHKTQFNDEGFKTLETYFKLNGLRIGLKKFTKFAEGYRVLTSTHMHCFVETDKYF